MANPVAEQPAAAMVTLTPDFTFDPAQVTIRRGEAVQWVNQGRAPQRVISDPARAMDKYRAALPDSAKRFDSGVLNAGAGFSHTFDNPTGTVGALAFHAADAIVPKYLPHPGPIG